MKKNLLSLALIVVNVQLFAQITISNSDMPVPNYYPVVSIDTLGLSNPNPSGANYTWDFTNLSPTIQRIDSFVSAPSAFFFSFPGATVARKLPGDPTGGLAGLGGVQIDNPYQFYKATSSQYQNMGFGGTVSGFPMSLVNNPVDIVYRFPLNYGDVDSSYSEAELDVPSFVYLYQNQTRRNHADGWGTLTTPFGTFSTLRVLSELNGYDSLIFNGFVLASDRNPQREYKWLSKGEKIPVLQINAAQSFNGQWLPGRATYRDNLQVGIAQSSLPLEVYPNPATDYIQLAWNQAHPQAFSVEIWDLEGKLQNKQMLQDARSVLSLGGLSAGIYIVKITEGAKTYQGKLTIK